MSHIHLISRTRRGFTLIELLVVIAIIGLLSSIVLASLTAAREKAQDASVKSNLSNARAQAEIFYESNGKRYASGLGAAHMCSETALADGVKGIRGFLDEALKASGSTGVLISSNAVSGTGRVVCHASVDNWAIIAPLNNEDAFCVDNTGFAGEVAVTALGAGDYTCR